MSLLKNEDFSIEKIPYPKEEIEHLVDQIIKLDEIYKRSETVRSSQQVAIAMETLNEGLRHIVMPRMIIKG